MRITLWISSVAALSIAGLLAWSVRGVILEKQSVSFSEPHNVSVEPQLTAAQAILGTVTKRIPALASDSSRLAAIYAAGRESNGIELVTGALKLTRADMRLIRDDIKRAQAANPNVPDLTVGRWYGFDTKEQMTAQEYGISNDSSVQEEPGKPYVMESGYIEIVNPKYTKRATPAETAAWFKQLQDIELESPGFTDLRERFPGLDKDFMRWVLNQKYELSFGGNDNIQLLRKTNKPFVWDDGSTNGMEAIDLFAPNGTPVSVIEAEVRKLAENNAWAIDQTNPDKSVSETRYHLKDGAVTKEMSVIEFTTPAARARQALQNKYSSLRLELYKALPLRKLTQEELTYGLDSSMNVPMPNNGWDPMNYMPQLYMALQEQLRLQGRPANVVQPSGYEGYSAGIDLAIKRLQGLGAN